MTRSDGHEAHDPASTGGSTNRLGWYQNWRERHQHPVSFGLHLIAIPLMPLAGVLVVIQLMEGAWHLWWRPLALLIVSYVIQWIGHLIEGNDMGELILVKKALGKPYIAIAPRYQGCRDQMTPSGQDG
ncbi:MAG: Mpo1-like protein [Phycisphaerae bacterium]